MRVAHVSDLHLLSLQGARPWSFLGKRLTGGVNLLFNRGGQFPESVARVLADDLRQQAVDHLLVSGDLTNLALPAEFRLAADVLRQTGLDPRRVTVIPGNHDYYTLDSRLRDHFAQALGPYLAGDVMPGPGALPQLRLQGELAVVALCSAHPSPPLMAWGTLGTRQLNQLEQLLSHESSAGRFRLVLLHHAPHIEHVKWDNRLRDREQLVQVLRCHGAELVVHGHLHRPLRLGLPGPQGEIPVVGVGSATWLSPKDPARRAQYNIYHIDGRELQRVETRQLDAAASAYHTI